jgi:glucose/mannose-6-phosphate isomerase
VRWLDDPHALAGRDPGGMLQQVGGLPAQLRHAAVAMGAFRSSVAAAVPPAPGRSVLVCGMGGSAIGGDMAAAWCAPRGVRIAVHRGYDLPAWVGPETQLVFSSYSGNTEETLSAFDAALQRGLRGVCIATGGELAARARRAGLPLYTIPAGLQPRAALGHSLAGLLMLLHATGLVEDPSAAIDAAARHLDTSAAAWGPASPVAANAAKRLAERCHGRLPVIYTGSGLTQPVGVRWRGQLNENAKSLAMVAAFPELDHNEIMAWQALPELRRVCLLLFLRDRDDSEPVARRMRITAEILTPSVGGLEWIDTSGEEPLARMLGLVWLGDWASVYLAFLNEIDPTPVAEIELLKRRLAQGPVAR